MVLEGAMTEEESPKTPHHKWEEGISERGKS